MRELLDKNRKRNKKKRRKEKRKITRTKFARSVAVFLGEAE